jgi:hypothetical protein
MNRKYEHSAYCSNCQRWIPKQALESNSLGAQMCPFCHNRVRVKRHPHDLPQRTFIAPEEVAENSKTVKESNGNRMKHLTKMAQQQPRNGEAFLARALRLDL